MNQLEKEKAEMSQLQTQQITVNQSQLEAMIEWIVSEKLQQASWDREDCQDIESTQ